MLFLSDVLGLYGATFFYLKNMRCDAELGCCFMLLC